MSGGRRGGRSPGLMSGGAKYPTYPMMHVMYLSSVDRQTPVKTLPSRKFVDKSLDSNPVDFTNFAPADPIRSTEESSHGPYLDYIGNIRLLRIFLTTYYVDVVCKC